MNTENTRAQKIKIVFAQYPNIESIFVTSDDAAFFEKSDAENHAKSLGNKKVVKVMYTGDEDSGFEQPASGFEQSGDEPLASGFEPSGSEDPAIGQEPTAPKAKNKSASPSGIEGTKK